MLKSYVALNPYPFSLVSALFNNDDEVPFITDDIKFGLEYALSFLKEREREILRMRYEEMKSVLAVSMFFCLSESRVRQIEKSALQRLRKQPYFDYIRYGIEGNINRLMDAEYDRGYNAGFSVGYFKGQEEAVKGISDPVLNYEIRSIPIEKLKLNVRTFNALKRCGYNVIYDLVKLSEEDIINIRNMGNKNIEEVANALSKYGIEYTWWARGIGKENQ